MPKSAGEEEIWPYRYKYFDGAGTEDRNIKVVRDGSIWYSAPNTLNDPFDCAPTAVERDQDNVRETAERFLRKNPGHFAKHPNFTHEQKVQHTIGLLNRNMSGPEFIAQFVSTFSVLCLTRSPVNELMWSHYGNSHKGFALEFDLRISLDYDRPTPIPDSSMYNLITMPVNYVKKRPSFDDERNTFLFYKSPPWAYELEERIVHDGLCGLQPYNVRALCPSIQLA